jgi:hypothetical protein
VVVSLILTGAFVVISTGLFRSHPEGLSVSSSSHTRE